MKGIHFIFIVSFIISLVSLKSPALGDDIKSANAEEQKNMVQGNLEVYVEYAPNAFDVASIEKALESNLEKLGSHEYWETIHKHLKNNCDTVRATTNPAAGGKLTDDTNITWKDPKTSEEKTWKLSQIKKYCGDFEAAVAKVTKEYCYQFTAFLHEKDPGEYLILPKWVTECSNNGTDVKCGPDDGDMPTNNYYLPKRIECAKMPKANQLGAAFKKLDPDFQKDIWRNNFCFEKKGGITVSSAAAFKPIKLAKGEFVGRKQFKGLEVSCFHKGIHTNKSAD